MSQGAGEKALGLLACLLFVVVALGNGLDRQSLLKPVLAERIPSIFASDALLARGQANLLAGRLDQALADGNAAVRIAPVDPGSSALLGSARLGLNDAIGAQQAFLVAGRMGWRVPLTQIYWMQRAIGLRNYAVAATRLDALLRQHPWMLADAPLLAPMEGSPQGRQAIANRLMNAPPWLYPFASEVGELPLTTVIDRVTVLGLLADRGLQVGCDRVALPANRLSEARRFAEAQTLWRSHCSETGPGLLADPQLQHLRINGARSYFEWDLVGSSDVGLAIVPGKSRGEQLIEAHNSAASPRIVLRQLLTIPPGSYRLDWQAATTDGKPTNRITAALGCEPNPIAPLAEVQLPGALSWSATLRVGSECPAHWLAFSILPGGDDLRFGGFRLETVR